MRKLLLFILSAAFVAGSFGKLNAQDSKDPESWHVIVTLKSGETVDGYIHSGWRPGGLQMKKPNYSFKITKEPNGSDPVKYTADDIISIDYTEKTENNPAGARFESRPLANPGIGNRNRTSQMILGVKKVGENATVYWYEAWTDNGGGGMTKYKRYVETYYGVRFHNDPDGIVYPYMLVNTVLMNPKYPGLKDFCKNWFKGEDGKAHKKEAEQNVAWMLDMYDAYLAQGGGRSADSDKAKDSDN
ncbi:MAG: hypothetical protein ACI3Y2_05145 [Candidatus Egerieousia sp.]